MKCKEISSKESYNSLKFMNSIHKNKKLSKFKSILDRKDVFVRYNPNYKVNQLVIDKKGNGVIRLNDSGCNVVSLAHELTHVKQVLNCGLDIHNYKNYKSIQKLLKLNISYDEICKVIYNCDLVLSKYYKNIDSLVYRKLKFQFLDILNSFTLGKYAINFQHMSHNEKYFKDDRYIALFEIIADISGITAVLSNKIVKQIFKEFGLLKVYNQSVKICKELDKQA